jgi:hypothetical protein
VIVLARSSRDCVCTSKPGKPVTRCADYHGLRDTPISARRDDGSVCPCELSWADRQARYKFVGRTWAWVSVFPVKLFGVRESCSVKLSRGVEGTSGKAPS